jgi:hypothetical protein
MGFVKLHVAFGEQVDYIFRLLGETENFFLFQKFSTVSKEKSVYVEQKVIAVFHGAIIGVWGYSMT